MGAVTVNGAPARSARAVHVGDEIGLRRWDDRTLLVRVTQVPATRQTSRQQAATLYEILGGASDGVEADFIP